MCAKKQVKMRWMLFFWLGLTVFILPTLACEAPTEEPLWTPENPREYTAEVQTVYEVYVAVDEAGNVVSFDGPYAYGAVANMRYVLRFWDVGNRIDGYKTATIYRVYTPTSIGEINDEIEDGLSNEQIADIYGRTTFPTTEVKLHELSFTGGPTGTFLGTNSETGKTILGYMDWREDVWEMHVVFTEDIQQDYLVLGEEPFYNWP